MDCTVRVQAVSRRLRVALNRISDRDPFPVAGDPVDRVLRQVADQFSASYRNN